MRKLLLLTVFGLYISINSQAGNNCSCKELQNNTPSQKEIVDTLENSDIDFKPTIKTTYVRGVLSARYYYCDEDHGFLLVNLHDEELLYKDVPLQTWFEFKFADSLNFYYKDEIKYNFIAINAE